MRLQAVLLCLLVSLSAVPTTHASEAVFRDLRWGDPMESLGDWYIVEEDGPIARVRRTNEDLQLGPLQAVLIEYQFFEGKLYRVIVATADPEGLESILRARYGPPTMAGLWSAVWYLPEQDLAVVFLAEGQVGAVSLASDSLLAEVMAWEEARKAAEAQVAW